MAAYAASNNITHGIHGCLPLIKIRMTPARRPSRPMADAPQR